MCQRMRHNKSSESWHLSPAYDLTYSNSIGGEHATTVHGNGKNPSMTDILLVAKEIGINQATAKRIATDIQECVYERLGEYLRNIPLIEQC